MDATSYRKDAETSLTFDAFASHLSSHFCRNSTNSVHYSSVKYVTCSLIIHSRSPADGPYVLAASQPLQKPTILLPQEITKHLLMVECSPWCLTSDILSMSRYQLW
ncbi:hypothetical protein SeLEV6574_g08464 [Synchytrium endobioticum]|uniref:Uncharacterized protein n=1 Tax=Synchytrium endobioticum TaxID=286115 RepID=A0A507BRV3_9FUNG|nr:hypothetical protein SeLEV6574_g08464 [Synchytrium endobioticum]